MTSNCPTICFLERFQVHLKALEKIMQAVVAIGSCSSGHFQACLLVVPILFFYGDASLQHLIWVSLRDHENHGNSILLKCYSKQGPPKAVLCDLLELACKITAISQATDSKFCCASHCFPWWVLCCLHWAPSPPLV